MIVFLNFAPIQYMGGAERKLYELFCAVDENEVAFMMTMHERIASIYGKFVMKQAFTNRSQGKLKLNQYNSLSLSILSFIPFTKQWRRAKNILQSARLIYLKGEINELLIVTYLGGVNILKKVIVGIRSPWLYPSPQGLFNHLHNAIYKSSFAKDVLKRAKNVHVLNEKDKDFFEREFALQNVVYIPNYADKPDIKDILKVKRSENELRIIFIGELLMRKGIDILIQVIQRSPNNYTYEIVGDGPMKKEITKLASENSQVTYHGYLDKSNLYNILNSCDVLFFPSRAEGFGAVILEAMSMGLKVVDSPYVYLNLPKDIEYAPQESNANEYLKILNVIYYEKKKKKLDREKIMRHFDNNFSEKKIMPILLHKMLGIET